MMLRFQILYFVLVFLAHAELSSSLGLRKTRQLSWSPYAEDQYEPTPRAIRQTATTSTTTTIPTTTMTSSTTESCVYTAEVPDFSAPGRRISEVKCHEFVWHRKYREEKKKRWAKCTTTYAYGGRNTLFGEFPHMGAIGWQGVDDKWVFKCGSTLISPNFALTAAHCTKASSRDTTISDPIPKIVRFGDKNIIKSNVGIHPVDANISRIIVYPYYKSPKKYFDIALLKLEKDVEFTNLIQPACLWSQFDVSSLALKATLTGWGEVESAQFRISPELQAAEVDVIDPQQCDRLLRPFCNRNWCGISDEQICGGKLSGGVDACKGDSGGPLQVKIDLPPSEQGTMHYVIGVISFGIGCGRPNVPGVYTRVSSFIDWIESEVWPVELE